MDLDLDGKTALITGASLGLGRAMAEAFHDAGANVALLARRKTFWPMPAAAIGGRRPVARSAAYPCDVTDPAQIEAAVTQATSELGGIDILINNAGQSQTGPFRGLDRRGMAVRPRPQAVRGHSPLAASLPGHEGARLGPDRQHP